MVDHNSSFTILVLSRNNTKKKSYGIDKFITECSNYADQVIYYTPERKIYELAIRNNIDKLLNGLPHPFKNTSKYIIHSYTTNRFVRRITQGIYLIFHPRLLFHTVPVLFSKNYASRHFIEFMKNLSAERIFIISHSAGGILAANVLNYEKIFTCISFGYPFRQAGAKEETYRTAPLSHIEKPFIIVQGQEDEYGSASKANKYTLSPLVKIISINSNHDYNKIPDEDYKKITEQFLSFIDNREIKSDDVGLH